MKQSVICLCFWLSALSYGRDICAFRFLYGVQKIPQYGTNGQEAKQISFENFKKQIESIRKELNAEFLILPQKKLSEKTLFYEFWNQYQIEEFTKVFFAYRNKKSWTSAFWKPFEGGIVYYWTSAEGLLMIVLESFEPKKIYFYVDKP
jgi:hypothetical protein